MADTADLADMLHVADMPGLADMARTAHMGRCVLPRGRSIGTRGRMEDRTMAVRILPLTRATRCLSTG